MMDKPQSLLEVQETPYDPVQPYASQLCPTAPFRPKLAYSSNIPQWYTGTWRIGIYNHSDPSLFLPSLGVACTIRGA